MQGSVYASAFSASSTIYTSDVQLAGNSDYAVVCEDGCSTVTLPDLTLVTTSAEHRNGRMFLIKNASGSDLTVDAFSTQTFAGGGQSVTLRPGEWGIVHAQNDQSYWQLYSTSRADAAGLYDVTYDQLMGVLASPTGATTGFYRINNYRTAGYVIGGGTSSYQGSIEPLIVTVYSTGGTPSILERAFSETYPHDVIHYDPYPENWYTDKSFCIHPEQGSATLVPNFRGVIYFRHDMKKNIRGTYDWRFCKTRRWNPDTGSVSAYSTSTVYSLGNLVTQAGSLYFRSAEGPTGTFDTSYWTRCGALMFPVEVLDNEFFNPSSTVRFDLTTDRYAPGGTGATYSVNIPVALGTYTDYQAFGDEDPDSICNVDLGNYFFRVGEYLTSATGASSALIGTIVNQNFIAEGSGPTVRNRVNNVNFGPRSWGNTILSAGSLDGNDQHNIYFEDRSENCMLNPFPSYFSSSVENYGYYEIIVDDADNVGDGDKLVLSYPGAGVTIDPLIVFKTTPTGATECALRSAASSDASWIAGYIFPALAAVPYISANFSLQRIGNFRMRFNVVNPGVDVSSPFAISFSGATAGAIAFNARSTTPVLQNLNLNIAPGFKNVRIKRAKNLWVHGSLEDSHIEGLRDTHITYCSGLRIGLPDQTNTYEYDSPRWQWSEGNVLYGCTNVRTGELRYTHLRNLRDAKFDSVERCIVFNKGGTAGYNVHVVGRMEDTVIFGRNLNGFRAWRGGSRNDFHSCELLNCEFSGRFERNVFTGGKLSNLHAQGDFMYNRGPSATVAGFQSTGSVYGCGFSGAYGVVVANGLTGTTGIGLKNALVMGGSIDGLDMSAVVQGVANLSKVYMQSEGGGRYFGYVTSGGAWGVTGATA